MISRWNTLTDLENLTESLLKSPPLNEIHPNYILAPNPVMKYPIIKGRRLYECEPSGDLQFFLLGDEAKQKLYSNCLYLCEGFVFVGVIRKKDLSIPEFRIMINILTNFFDTATSTRYVHLSLTDGNEVIEEARLGSFGITKCEIQSTRKASDNCGVFTYEILIKYSMYFHK